MVFGLTRQQAAWAMSFVRCASAWRAGSWLTAPVAILCASVSGGARSQSLETFFPTTVPGYAETSSVPVIDRPRSDYEPLAIRAGEFIIRPRLDEATGYDSNPTGTSPGHGSAFITTAPSVSINSDFARNSVGLSFGLTDQRFLALPQQDRTDYTVSAGGTYEVGRDQVTAAASYLSLHEDPSQIDSATIRVPLHYAVIDLVSKYTKNVGRWQIEPNLEYLQYRFDNVVEPGDTVSQTARDRNLYSAGTTLRYNVQERRGALLEVRAVDTNYVQATNGPRPDSFAYELLGGVDYAVSGNLRFVALVGYAVREFSNRAFSNQASPVTRAAVTWTPTGLTTITGHVERTIEDSIGESTSGVVYTRGDLKLDQEFRRNWLFSATAGLEIADYASGGGTEKIYSAGASASYLFNRSLRASASYTFANRSGSESIDGSVFGTSTSQQPANYNRSIVLFSLRLTP